MAGAICRRLGAAQSRGFRSLLFPPCVSSNLRCRRRAILYLWLKRDRPQWPLLRISNNLLAAAFAAYFILYFFNAMAPEASPDGSTYHLGLVARYLREHGFRPITWDIYANFSEGVEMLFLFAFAFGKHSAAAMVHFVFLVALSWQMVIYARRAGFPQLGACAALLVFASPVVGKDATSAYNDVALACVAFALFSLLQAWDEERVEKLLIPIGLMAGFGYAIKYTGAVGIVYAIAFVAWKSWRRSREVRPALIVALVATLVAGPWLVKNWMWVQNPVSPFFNRLFPNPFVTTWFETDYRRYLALYDLTSRWQIPWSATVTGRARRVARSGVSTRTDRFARATPTRGKAVDIGGGGIRFYLFWKYWHAVPDSTAAVPRAGYDAGTRQSRAGGGGCADAFGPFLAGYRPALRIARVMVALRVSCSLRDALSPRGRILEKSPAGLRRRRADRSRNRAWRNRIYLSCGSGSLHFAAPAGGVRIGFQSRGFTYSLDRFSTRLATLLAGRLFLPAAAASRVSSGANRGRPVAVAHS